MKAATCNSTTEKLHHSNVSHRDTQCIASEMGSCSPHVVCKPWDGTCKAVIQHAQTAKISHMIIVYKYTDIIFANHEMHSAGKKTACSSHGVQKCDPGQKQQQIIIIMFPMARPVKQCALMCGAVGGS